MNLAARRLRWLSLAGMFLSWCVSNAQSAAGVRMPAYERIVLPNGAILLLMERHDVPLIAFNAVSRGGAITDAPRIAGATGLLAELLVKGAGARNALQFAEAVEAAGGVIEASAGVESLNVSGEFLARDQELMVQLLSDLLQRPRLERDEFEKLRARQIEFIRAAKDSNLGSLLPVYASAALFGDHPYGHVVSGSEASLAALRYEEVRDAYQQQVGGDRLILAVSGDFNAAKMKRLLSEAFGKWRRAGAQLPALAAATPVAGRRVLLVDAPNSVQTYFWIGNVGVSRTHPQRVALDVVNTLFGGRFTSMLNSELRVRSGLTYGASSRFRRMTQPGSWAMSSFTRTESTAEAVDLALQVFENLHGKALDDAALASGKSYVLGQFPTGYETAAQWAGVMGELEFYGLQRDDVDRYAERVAATDASRARRAIVDAFPAAGDLQFVFIGNAAQIRETVAKYGPVTEMKLSEPVFTR